MTVYIYYYTNGINGEIDASFSLDKYLATVIFMIQNSDNVGLYTNQKLGSYSLLSC